MVAYERWSQPEVLAFADPFEIDLNVHVDHMNLYYFVHYSEQPFSLQTLHGKVDD